MEATAQPGPSKWDGLVARDLRWFVGSIGRLLVGLGLLVVSLVGYQLYGTGIQTAAAQRSLAGEFEQILSSSTLPIAQSGSSGDAAPESDGSVVGSPPKDAVRVEPGSAVGRLEIPAIGVDDIVVAGVRVSDLRRGPGYFLDSPLPGHLGNSAIAGHRTTYGQPFRNIDQLERGDEIRVTTVDGVFVYRVVGQQIVAPTFYEVIATTDPDRATLTLISCHPAFTARERIVVLGELDASQSSPVRSSPTVGSGSALPSESPALTSTGVSTSPGVLAQGWFGDSAAAAHVGAWGVAVAVVAGGSYMLSRRLRRDRAGFIVGVLPFLLVLYFFLQNVNRLFPSGF